MRLPARLRADPHLRRDRAAHPHRARGPVRRTVLKFANGVVGVLDINWLTPTKRRDADRDRRARHVRRRLPRPGPRLLRQTPRRAPDHLRRRGGADRARDRAASRWRSSSTSSPGRSATAARRRSTRTTRWSPCCWLARWSSRRQTGQAIAGDALASGAGVRIAVVGLGHIGLPLAVQYASRGHDVIGCDIDDADRRDASTAASRRTTTSRRSSSACPSWSRAGACAPRPEDAVGRARGRGGGRHRPGRRRRSARDRLRPDRRRHARHRAPTCRAGDAGHLRDDAARRHDPRSVRTDARGGQRPRRWTATCSSPSRPERVLVGRVLLDLRRYPEDRGRHEPGEHAARGGVLSGRPRRGDRGAGRRQRRGGRDDEAGRDDLPRREHRATPTSSRATPPGAGSTSPR